MIRFILCLLAVAISQLSAAAEPRHLEIACVGDSITAGYGYPGSYREFLFKKLTAANIVPEFVGRFADKRPENAAWAKHSGVAGWTILSGAVGYEVGGKSGQKEGMDRNIPEMIKELAARGKARAGYTGPDYLPLMIGTNDMNKIEDPAHNPPWFGAKGAPERLKTLLRQTIDALDQAGFTSTRIVVQTIPDITGNSDNVRAYNDAIASPTSGLPSMEAKYAQRIILADTRFKEPNSTTLTMDKLHPNQAGAEVIGDGFATAILADLQHRAGSTR
jgi:lysophospholipase L1-like esterase